MNNEKFSIKKRLKSFVYAFNGLLLLIKNEHNARIHLVTTVCAVIAGFWFNISSLEWIVIIFAIGFVISFEIVNSSIEQLADFVSPERREKIKSVKDLAAAAVLVAAITAACIGLVIFIPKIIAM
ncbi:MAG: diacylglycerol kinase family protein [Cytophagaceae bacterium]|jgi:diacylglycerol kinase|nr:diacylglycerol kinase family protein [Cytophagaceae bacterium]